MSKATIFMSAGWFGLFGLAVTSLALLASLPSAIELSGSILAMACCVVMLATRKADEFTMGLWNAGASLAFGAMLLAFPGLPFLEGVYDGLSGADKNQNIPASVIPIFAIVAFYIGLFAKRLMGDG